MAVHWVTCRIGILCCKCTFLEFLRTQHSVLRLDLIRKEESGGRHSQRLFAVSWQHGPDDCNGLLQTLLELQIQDEWGKIDEVGLCITYEPGVWNEE